jgi:hypothetical protein
MRIAGRISMTDIGRPRDNDSHNICLMDPTQGGSILKGSDIMFVFMFPQLMQATRSPIYATLGGKRNGSLYRDA